MAISKANIDDFGKHVVETKTTHSRRIDGKDALNPYPEDIITTDFDVDREEHERLIAEGVIGLIDQLPAMHKSNQDSRMRGRAEDILGEDYTF